MTCESTRERMPDHLTRRLQPQEIAALERHLNGCASCRREWELEQVLARALKMPSPVPPSPDFAARLLAQIQEEKAQEAKRHPWGFLAKLSYGTAGVLGLMLFGWMSVLEALRLTGGDTTGWFRQVSALLVAKITEGTTLYTGFWVGLEDSFGRLLGQMSNPEILFPVLLVVFVVQAVPSLYFFFHVQSSS